MGLKSLVYRPGGKNSDGVDVPPGLYLNALKRFCLSGLMVPRQELAIAKIPAAQSATQPGRSPIIPLQGPPDAWSEVFSFTGKQNVTFKGMGLITTSGADTNVTGVGTKFTSQLQIGDTISTTNGAGTILTIVSDTLATTAANMAANSLKDYFFVTTSSAVIQRQVFCKIHDQAWRRYLMNRDVPVYHVFGSNTKPLFMKESLLLETDQTLQLEFLNYNTTGRASFAPMAEMRKWQYEAMKYPKVNNFIGGLFNRKQFVQPYWLTLDDGFKSLGAAGSATANTTAFLTVTGDITFIAFNLYADSFVDVSGSTDNKKILIEMQDPKTGRSMQNVPIAMSNVSGNAQNPCRLSTPWIIEPQTQIKVTMRNLTTALSCKVYITLHGVAIYTGSSFHGSTLTNKRLIEEAQKMYQAMSIPQVRPASPRN